MITIAISFVAFAFKLATVPVLAVIGWFLYYVKQETK